MEIMKQAQKIVKIIIAVIIHYKYKKTICWEFERVS